MNVILSLVKMVLSKEEAAPTERIQVNTITTALMISLFLESDASAVDDSFWKITFKGDTMRWRGTGTSWAERFELIHVRNN